MPNSPFLVFRLFLLSIFVFGLFISPFKTLAEVFSDISGHLHQVPIEELYRWGFIQGYSDETFRPDAPINRAELLKILETFFINLFVMRKSFLR